MKRIIRCKFIHLLLVIILFVELLPFFSVNIVVAEEKQQEIRVGLATSYSNLNEIKVNNSKLTLGYCINNKFKKMTSFSSKEGFVFKPFDEIYAVSKNTYSSFKKAKNASKEIEKLGINAYPAYLDYRKVKIVICASDNKKLKKAIKKINNKKTELTFSEPKEDCEELVQVKLSNTSFIINGSGANGYPQFLPTSTNKESIIELKNNSYRGRIEIGKFNSSKISAINIVELEKYLYGVVPCEMLVYYDLEALKAQAVCSRSFAYCRTSFKGDSRVDNPYDLVDSTAAQVYKGYNYENKISNQAVNLTKGKCIYLNDKVVPAYYFSTSGGRTEDVKNVWGNESSYLKSVIDKFEWDPERKPWFVELSFDQINERLEEAEIEIGGFTKISRISRTDSNRIYKMEIKGSAGSEVLNMAQIRKIFGLPSNKFNIITKKSKPSIVYASSADNLEEIDLKDSYCLSAGNTLSKLSDGNEQLIIKSSDNTDNISLKQPKDKKTILFAGLGSGHGVGMSQSGANGLAKAGYNYKQILKYYYQGVDIR